MRALQMQRGNVPLHDGWPIFFFSSTGERLSSFSFFTSFLVLTTPFFLTGERLRLSFFWQLISSLMGEQLLPLLGGD